MTTTRVHFQRATVAALTATLTLATAQISAPAIAQQSGEAQPYQAVVTGDDLYVRSGAGDTYYPFGRLSKGDIVTVSGERFGWARIVTEGPSFSEFFGYVKAEDIRVEGGNVGVTLGKVDVYAPNLLRDASPDSSWKWVVRLDPEAKVAVLGTVPGDQTSFLKIAMPTEATGWISASFLKAATASDVAAWKDRLAQEAAATTARAESTVVAPTSAGAAQGAAVTRADSMANAPPTTPVQVPDSTQNADNATTGSQPATTDTPPVATDATANDSTTPPVANDPLATPEVTETETTTNSEAEPAEPDSKTLAEVTFEDIEDAYESLKEVPIREAEIEPMIERYRAVLESGVATDKQTIIASGRIELLQTRQLLQDQVLNLDKVRSRAEITTEHVQAARLAFDLAADYAAVGKVSASTIYDGRRLPRLLRVTDPASGRTIAYLQPDEESFDYVGLIDQLVGIVGEKSYDGGLRLTIIAPRRIDLLTTHNR